MKVNQSHRFSGPGCLHECHLSPISPALVLRGGGRETSSGTDAPELNSESLIAVCLADKERGGSFIAGNKPCKEPELQSSVVGLENGIWFRVVESERRHLCVTSQAVL